MGDGLNVQYATFAAGGFTSKTKQTTFSECLACEVMVKQGEQLAQNTIESQVHSPTLWRINTQNHI